jgi:hypothetical protein
VCDADNIMNTDTNSTSMDTGDDEKAKTWWLSKKKLGYLDVDEGR